MDLLSVQHDFFQLPLSIVECISSVHLLQEFASMDELLHKMPMYQVCTWNGLLKQFAKIPNFI